MAVTNIRTDLLIFINKKRIKKRIKRHIKRHIKELNISS